RDPRDVETIERLQQRIQELEFQQLQQDSPAEEAEIESNVWDDRSEDVNPFGRGNPRYRDRRYHPRRNDHVVDCDDRYRDDPIRSMGLKIEIPEFTGKVPSNYHCSLCSLGMRVSSLECIDKAPYYPGFYGDHHDNPLLTKETESEPIIWDIGDEEEEYHFVNKYLSFQEELNMLVEEESCPVYDIDNEEDAERAPKYDSDGDELVYEDEEVCLGESLVIQRVLSVAPSKSINDDSWRWNNTFRTKSTSKGKVCNMIIGEGSCENVVSTYMVEKLALKTVDHPEPYQLTWLKKGNVVKVSKRCFLHFSSGKKYQEGYLKAAPIDDKLGFTTIKVRGRVVI
ncbi:hypothetical protein Tco_1510645, partial [Tanacetum coccineum]